MSERLGYVERTPVSITTMLPGLLASDEFAAAFSSALDDVLAPVHRTLDSFWAYLDPTLAPLDFTLWLATWLNAEPDESWSEARIRHVALQAWSGFVGRGTYSGLVAELERLADGEWSVVDTGGVARSQTPGAALPGSTNPTARIELVPTDVAAVDRPRLERLIAAHLPAHVRLEFSVVGL